MSKFSETLNELMINKGLNKKTLGQAIGIPHAQIGTYVNDKYIPTIENLIKLCNFFDCSLDFMLGNDETNRKYVKNNPPAEFAVVYREMLKRNKTNTTKVAETLKVSTSMIYSWLNKKHKPSTEKLMALSKIFGCSIDYLVGIEKL